MAEADSPEVLSDADELLHRQVHPTFVDGGRIGSNAFTPTPKDEGRLSVSRDTLSTAQEAHTLYTEGRGLESVGVWSVTVGECKSLDLKACADPLLEPIKDEAHAFVDFRQISASATTRRLAKKLAAFARARRRQYPPHEAND